MATAKWSVRLVVADDVAGPVSQFLGVALANGVHWLGIGGGRFGADDEDEPCWITIELDANYADEARVIAQHLVGKVYAAAGLAPKELPVAWVAPLSGDGDEASSHRFLGQARELAEQELYELAVVSAQIHLEVQVRTLMKKAAEADPSPVAAAVVAQRRTGGPHDRNVKPFLEALLSVRVKDFDRWEEYLEHVTRRNAVVHGGQAMTAESAAASIDVVSALWLWLNAGGESADPSTAPSASAGAEHVEQLTLFESS